jgi:hypothetical protein
MNEKGTVGGTRDRDTVPFVWFVEPSGRIYLCNPRANWKKRRVSGKNDDKGVSMKMAMRKIFRRFCAADAEIGTLSLRIG